MPKLEQRNDENEDGLDDEEYAKAKLQINKEPFKRGAMAFEDYNYHQMNKYILIDPDFKEEAYVSDPELSQFTEELGQ